ncbi:MAG: hypothetical protein ACRDDM_04420 [Paraclostridium sp.]
MKSEKLRDLHRAMIKDKVTTYSFKFRYDNKYGKNIVFDVVFIADGVAPFFSKFCIKLALKPVKSKVQELLPLNLIFQLP